MSARFMVRNSIADRIGDITRPIEHAVQQRVKMVNYVIISEVVYFPVKNAVLDSVGHITEQLSEK